MRQLQGIKLALNSREKHTRFLSMEQCAKWDRHMEGMREGMREHFEFQLVLITVPGSRDTHWHRKDINRYWVNKFICRISFNFHIYLIIPTLLWGNWGSERLRNVSMITQQVYKGMEIQIPLLWHYHQGSSHFTLFCTRFMGPLRRELYWQGYSDAALMGVEVPNPGGMGALATLEVGVLQCTCK